MIGRVLLASILSALLVFAWGYLFWGVSGAVEKVVSPLPAELDLLASLRNSQAPSGMYVYPMHTGDSADKETMAEWQKKHQDGPLLQMAYRREGSEPMELSKFAQGLALNFVVALLTSCLLALSVRGLPHFGGRLVFVLLVSLVAATWANVGDVVWWFHSPQYCLGNMAYMLGSGLLMGLVLATLIRSANEEPAA